MSGEEPCCGLVKLTRRHTGPHLFCESIEGEPRNESDGVLKGIRDPKAKKSVIIPFAPLKNSRAGELAARFDIVMGFTPEA